MHDSIVIDDMGRGGPYAHAVIAGDIIFVSGQTGQNESNKGDFISQFKASMDKIGRISSKLGKSLRDVAKVTVYLSDGKYFRHMNDLFKEYFTESPPARTTVVVGFASEGTLVEIDAILY